MKKYLPLWIATFFFSLAACNTRPPDPNAAIEELPKFQFLSADSMTHYSSDRLPESHAYIFMLFDPNCEHCQKMTKIFIAHRAELAHANIYMITFQPAGETIQFIKYFHLDTLQHILVCIDDHYSFYKTFSPKSIPYIAVYNAHKRLTMTSTGEITIADLVQNMN